MEGLTPGMDIPLEKVAYFVEANSFEMHALNYMYVTTQYIPSFDPIPWKHITCGWGLAVGSSKTQLMFRFAELYGQIVCFYEVTSMKADWNDVETFLEKYYWNKHTNPMNFSKCISALRKQN
jgi:hypothetical protein